MAVFTIPEYFCVIDGRCRGPSHGTVAGDAIVRRADMPDWLAAEVNVVMTSGAVAEYAVVAEGDHMPGTGTCVTEIAFAHCWNVVGWFAGCCRSVMAAAAQTKYMIVINREGAPVLPGIVT